MSRPRASVFIAVSLDGFIAREDGGLDWLPMPKPGAEDYGYKRFIAAVDTLVMGRKTFETVLSFGGTWPYEVPVVVLSRRPLAIPKELAGKAVHMCGTPPELIEALEKRGAKHLYVDGGATIRGFLKEGLIQRITLTRVPVLLGAGVPLFGGLGRDVKLTHVETKAFPDGLVQSTYEIAA